MSASPLARARHRIRWAVLVLFPLITAGVARSAEVAEVARIEEEGVARVALGDLLRPLGGIRRSAPDLGPIQVRVRGQDVTLLPGSTLVHGTPRSWTLSHPVVRRQGRTWVPEDFVPLVLAELVPTPLALTGSRFFVGVHPGSLDSLTVADLGTAREITFHGSFPFAPELDVRAGQLRVDLPGCASMAPLSLAKRDSLVVDARDVSISGGTRVTIWLRDRSSQATWREQAGDRLRLLVGPGIGDGPAPGEAPATARARVSRIVIDPGHGGVDGGASLAKDLEEKWVTLELARLLADSLNVAGFEVILTRNEDRVLTPEERAELANESQADLFISVQLSTYPLGEGADIVCLTHEFMGAATRPKVVAGFRMVPWGAVHEAHLEDSRAVAEWILGEFDGGWPGSAPLKQLAGLDMPAVGVLVPARFVGEEIWGPWCERFAASITTAVLGWSGREPAPPWHRGRGGYR